MARGTGTGNDVPGREPTVDGAVADLVAEARADDGARARRRARWLEVQALAGVTFRSLCQSFAEAGVSARIGLADGVTHHGRLVEIGDDVVVVRTVDDRLVLLPDRLVAWLHPRGAVPVTGHDPAPTDGDGDDVAPAPSGVTLHALLTTWAEDRAAVQLRVGDVVFDGSLRWVGVDVAALDLVGETGRGAGGRSTETIYVRLSSLAEASLSVSG